MLLSETSSAPAGFRRDPMLLGLAAWTVAGVLVLLLTPRAAPFLLPLAVLAPLSAHWALKGLVRWPPPSAAFVALGLAGAYLLINSTWSLSPEAAYPEIACLLLFSLAGYATIAVLGVTGAPLLAAMATGFVAAMLVGAAVLCFEAFSGQGLRRLLIALLPTANGGAGPPIVFLLPYQLNPGMAALALLFWPAALAITRVGGGVGSKRLLLFGLGLAVAAILRSEHASSKIALAGASLTFGLCWLAPVSTRRLVIAAWVTATVLVVPLASLAYSHQLYSASWVPQTAGMRLVIWGYTSAQIDNAPLLGAGVSSARALHHKDDQHPIFAPGSHYRLSTGWHSHNAYLQTWFEAGALGAALLLAFGLAVLQAVALAPGAAQPYLYASFVSCALMASSSFSLWAPWFLALLGFSAIFAVLGTELATGSQAGGVRTGARARSVSGEGVWPRGRRPSLARP